MMHLTRRALLGSTAAVVVAGGAAPLLAQTVAGAVIGEEETEGALQLIGEGRVARVVIAEGADPALKRAASDLRADLRRVAGDDAGEEQRLAVIVGVLGQHPLIDRLAAAGRLDAAAIRGGWEAFAQAVVDRPAPGIDRALVIAGSDRRGAMFGLYDLSRRIGVSPWHWWADVPVRRRETLFVSAGARADRPAVRHRGIFLNDEEPALGNWARATFGGINAVFYERVFELILRLKGNMIWPAMWGKSLWEDDPASAALAERMGIVLGTSHHEPMLRAHVDWERNGEGPWDYARNADRLRAFWRAGLERNGGREALVTVGMRGDGDEPMTEGTATALLERIVADQRAIVADVTGRPAAETPQVWALYKEVQDYYDQGMRVPDDVTLLFADDNWGNIRRLPAPGDRRPGGSGVYYHFDYVGGPRNYKWLNTNQISRTWEQMRLARAHGADRLWMVNVGDLKPMELPTSFFLDMAWSPDAMTMEAMADYHRAWAVEQFGASQAEAIASVLDRTTRYAARRKPELIDPDTWSLTHDDEADRVLADYAALEVDAEAAGRALPAEAKDAFFQLVQHPALAAANLNRLYVTVARNRLHAEQGRADTNALADEAGRLFANDAAIRRRYEALAGGKWVHMMAQTHIGYTGWQQPERDVMPDIRRINVPAAPAVGVMVEGSREAWTGEGTPPALPPIERYDPAPRWIEVFDRGGTRATVIAGSDAPWLRIEPIENSPRYLLRVDWTAAPAGDTRTSLRIDGAGQRLALPVLVRNRPAAAGHVAAGGTVAIEAADFARSVPTGTRWAEIPNLGRTRSAIAPLDPIAPSAELGRGAMVEYELTLWEPGEVSVDLVGSPSLDVVGKRGLRYAIALDHAAPQVVDLWDGDMEAHWDKAVSDAVRVSTSTHRVAAAGRHRLRLWMVDPGLVVQRLIVRSGPASPSTLGPRASVHV